MSKRSVAGKPDGFLERLSRLILRQPEDRAQLLQLLHAACARSLLDAEALSIIEGALAASETAVRDIMVPRTQMACIDIEAAPEEIRRFVVASGHSRFPVYSGARDDIVGILHAKDLLRQEKDAPFAINAWLRPAIFIPEGKRLDVLLREFRLSRNHIAVVVDEYGGVAGLVSIEDVLEPIVGDIEDEFDPDAPSADISLDACGGYRVMAQTELDDFNRAFAANLAADGVDTIGGLILSRLGRVPRRNETFLLDGFNVRILRADSRRLQQILVEPLPAPPEAEAGARRD